MSRVKKYTNFDNNPNSVFGASKRVLQSYRKKLDEGEDNEPLTSLTQPVSILKQKPSSSALKPSIQGITTSESSDVVSNLNEFTLLIKSLTNNINTADLYLRSSYSVSKAPPAKVAPLTGSGIKHKSLRGGGKYADDIKKGKTPTGIKVGNETLMTPEEADTYLLNKWKNEGGNLDRPFTDEEKGIIKYFGLALGNFKKVSGLKPVIEKREAEVKPEVKPESQTKITEHFKPTAEQTVLNDELNGEDADVKDRIDKGIDREELIDADEGYDNPMPIDIFGQPQRYDANDEFDDEIEGISREATGEAGYNILDDLIEEGVNQVVDEHVNDVGDDEEEKYAKTPAQYSQEAIAIRGRPEVKENYIISLFSTINGQINKVADFWGN